MLCKYKWGQKVRFPFRDTMKEGYIEIVDAFGTFEQKEEPSYDIMVYPDDCLYKHVRESMIERTLEETNPWVRGRLVYNEEIQKYGIRYSKDGYQVLMDSVTMVRFAGSSEWISVNSVNLEDCIGYHLEAKIKGIKEADAVKIDGALKAMKMSSNISIANEVRNESRRFLEYEIEFE